MSDVVDLVPARASALRAKIANSSSAIAGTLSDQRVRSAGPGAARSEHPYCDDPVQRCGTRRPNRVFGRMMHSNLLRLLRGSRARCSRCRGNRHLRPRRRRARPPSRSCSARPRTTPIPGCPAPDACEVVARVTGIQMTCCGRRSPFPGSPASGQLVAWWLKLPELRSRRSSTFNGLFGGEPAARIAVLRRGKARPLPARAPERQSAAARRSRTARAASATGSQSRCGSRRATTSASPPSPGFRPSRSTSTPAELMAREPPEAPLRHAAEQPARALRGVLQAHRCPARDEHRAGLPLHLPDRATPLLGADRARRTRRHVLATLLQEPAGARRARVQSRTRWGGVAGSTRCSMTP